MSSQRDEAPSNGARQPPGAEPPGAETADAQPGGAGGADPGRLVMPGLTPRAGAGPTPSPRRGKKLASAWRTSSDGSKVFQMTAPVAGWWTWVAVAVVALADLAVQGRDRAAVQAAIALVGVTGLVYACAFRPKVIADEQGITVRNPIRDYRLPWGAVTGVYLGDSVEFQYARPAPRPDKTVYSWGLYTRRRARARARLKAQARERRPGPAGRPAGYARFPGAPPEDASAAMAEIMAKELVRLREEATARGAAPGVVTSSWAWQPVAAVVIPAIGLLLVFVAR